MKKNRRNQVFYHNKRCTITSDYNDDDDEIEETSEDLFEISLNNQEEEEDLFSIDIQNVRDVVVHVHVGVGHSGESSMEALLWALKHYVTPFTILHFIHVLPHKSLIPTPFGKIPRKLVNEQCVDTYLTQEKSKRKVLLQKFIDLCNLKKVKVEMLLIEGDNVAKAIVEFVNNLHIKKLVIGTSKYHLRRRQGIASKVLKNLAEKCDVKIICEGEEVTDQIIGIECSSSPPSNRVSQTEDESIESVPLMHLMKNSMRAFRPRFQ
ncbi:hypothetical protein PIB30_012140 [Stylosanthes scabra]|uniref:UspA domain-containing protein n=1 Tax=Stylosanthes scabra TaxID=79078 RepID=A0ABU6S6M7_9FABA|nr:hypothetical protein [Stylosanthes scabra]